jgi:uncharacterized protein (DUF697 family)/GTP-binding protein EngB required for normal cell division
MLDPDFNVAEEVDHQLRKVFEDMKRVNVVIAGRSGVGKSTLINAIFQGNLATTGQGRPVTSRTTEYTKAGLPLAILDTRGLEMDKYQETLAGLEKLICDRRAEGDIERQPHVAWVCISEDSRRVEEGESKVVDLFVRCNLPVVAVITKARNDQGFSNTVRELLPRARNVMRVRALAEVDEEGNKLEQKGLPELIEVTAELVPDAHRNAFAAIQKVNLELKKSRARRYVIVAAGSAATAGAIPIPFSDAVLLIPIEVAMLAGISGAFGLPVQKAFLSTIVSSSFVALAGTLAGRAIVGGLLKLIPGVGSVVGGAISGATAALLTTTFGEIYIKVLAMLFERNAGEPPSADEVATALKAAIKKRTP